MPARLSLAFNVLSTFPSRPYLCAVSSLMLSATAAAGYRNHLFMNNFLLSHWSVVIGSRPSEGAYPTPQPNPDPKKIIVVVHAQFDSTLETRLSHQSR